MRHESFSRPPSRSPGRESWFANPTAHDGQLPMARPPGSSRFVSDPTGRTIVMKGHVTVPPREGGAGRGRAPQQVRRRSPMPTFSALREARRHPASISAACAVETGLGYTFTYLLVLPPGFGGVPSWRWTRR